MSTTFHPFEADSGAPDGVVCLRQVPELVHELFRLTGKPDEVDLGSHYHAVRLSDGIPVGLTLVRPGMDTDRRVLEHLEKTVLAASQCTGPFVVRPLALFQCRDHLVLVEESVEGIDLRSVLRHCKAFGLHDASPLLRQVAMAVDGAFEAGLKSVEIQAHQLVVQFADPRLGANREELKRVLDKPLRAWPPFLIRLSPDYLCDRITAAGLPMTQVAQFTVVLDSDQAPSVVSRIARLLYLVVSGRPVPATAVVSSAAYVSIPGVSEEGNRCLSRAMVGETDHRTAVALLDALLRIERIQPPTLQLPIIPPPRSVHVAPASPPPVETMPEPVVLDLPFGGTHRQPTAPPHVAEAGRRPPTVAPSGPLMTPVPGGGIPLSARPPTARPRPAPPSEPDMWQRPPTPVPPMRRPDILPDTPSAPPLPWRALVIGLGTVGVAVVGALVWMQKPQDQPSRDQARAQVSEVAPQPDSVSAPSDSGKGIATTPSADGSSPMAQTTPDTGTTVMGSSPELAKPKEDPAPSDTPGGNPKKVEPTLSPDPDSIGRMALGTNPPEVPKTGGSPPPKPPPVPVMKSPGKDLFATSLGGFIMNWDDMGKRWACRTQTLQPSPTIPQMLDGFTREALAAGNIPAGYQFSTEEQTGGRLMLVVVKKPASEPPSNQTVMNPEPTSGKKTDASMSSAKPAEPSVVKVDPKPAPKPKPEAPPPPPEPEFKTASLIKGRYDAVTNPWREGDDLEVGPSAWKSGTITDPKTKKKVQMPDLDDPKLEAKVVNADEKTVRNPYTGETEEWSGTWQPGASRSWGGSRLTYHLPSSLPEPKPVVAEFVSYTSVRHPADGSTVTVGADDWSAGKVKDRRSGVLILPKVKDRKLDATIIDADQQTVKNPFTDQTMTWQGKWEKGAQSSWGPFTMVLPKPPPPKKAAPVANTIPESMRRNFYTQHNNIRMIYKSGDGGQWVANRGFLGESTLKATADPNSLCETLTTAERKRRTIPEDYHFVIDGSTLKVVRGQ